MLSIIVSYSSWEPLIDDMDWVNSYIQTKTDILGAKQQSCCVHEYSDFVFALFQGISLLLTNLNNCNTASFMMQIWWQLLLFLGKIPSQTAAFLCETWNATNPFLVSLEKSAHQLTAASKCWFHMHWFCDVPVGDNVCWLCLRLTWNHLWQFHHRRSSSVMWQPDRHRLY